MIDNNIKVFFDGGCPVCSREIQFYRRKAAGARIQWINLRLVPESDLPVGYSREALLKRFHIEHSDAGIVSGALAFAYLWQEMFRWGWIVRVVKLPIVRETCDLSYKGFLFLRRIFIQRTHSDLDTHNVR